MKETSLYQKRVNYDEIAQTYNLRFAESDETGISQELLTLAQDVNAMRILETGCGTARWLVDLQSITGQLYGLDLSRAMLNKARQRAAQLYLVQGKAEQLPYPPASFDLVYCVNALHHFHQPHSFIEEAYRLLRRGGALAIIGMDPRRGAECYYLYQYFEGTFETDLARFPPREMVQGWMIAAGFTDVEQLPVENIRHDFIGSSVLADPFLQKASTSQLVLLSDEAYAAGMHSIQEAVVSAVACGRTITFPVDIQIDMLVGRVTLR